MPRVSSLYGIAIYMGWNEAHHARPHFHARYAGEAASIDLVGELIAGSLPRRALMLVAQWADAHREKPKPAASYPPRAAPPAAPVLPSPR